MSRFRRMANNVASSYAALIAASLFSLATVPVAVHYLGDNSERFGLWFLMSTITGYMALIDLGMSGSVARLLIDYKDQRDGGEYGSLIKTGCLVLLVQAVIILSAGIAFAPLLASLLKIKSDLQSEFISLLGWQSVSMALVYGVRIFSHLLSAHQRSDIQNYGQVCGFGFNFILMWLFFKAGHGVFSLAWASLLTNIFGGLVCLVACLRLNLFPRRGAWGSVSWPRFKELFQFGQDMFLVSLGTQMIMGSQILIIQRCLGTAAATLWGIGSRTFLMVSQIIWRISDSAGPTFSEMIVRGEKEKLKSRYKEMVILTASFSGFFAVGFALCNSVFVNVWTSGKYDWPVINDLALSVWMIVLAVLHCHNGFVLLTKKIAAMRYVYFIEGLVFVVITLAITESGGLLTVILTSVLCSCTFSGAYGIWRVKDYFKLSATEVGLSWSALLVKTVTFCSLIAISCWSLFHKIENPVCQLSLYVAVYVVLGLWFFLRFGLTSKFQTELRAISPKFLNPILRLIFLVNSSPKKDSGT